MLELTVVYLGVKLGMVVRGVVPLLLEPRRVQPGRWPLLLTCLVIFNHHFLHKIMHIELFLIFQSLSFVGLGPVVIQHVIQLLCNKR